MLLLEGSFLREVSLAEAYSPACFFRRYSSCALEIPIFLAAADTLPPVRAKASAQICFSSVLASRFASRIAAANVLGDAAPS